MAVSNNTAIMSGQEMFEIAEDLVEIGPRRAGTPEAQEAESYLLQKLKDAGMEDVRLEPMEMTRWWSERSDLCVLAGAAPPSPAAESVDCFPIWHTGATPAEGVTAEMVYVGCGTQRDFESAEVRGKTVLIDGRMILNFAASWRIFDSLNLAKEHGAVGVVAINRSPADSITYLDAPTGVEEWENILPAVSVCTVDGAYLRYLCTAGKAGPTVTLRQEARTEPATSHTVLATLPGKTDEIILVGTHTDSTFCGAVDNAGANAGLIALARYCANLPLESREKTVVFAGWTGHEVNGIGAADFASRHKEMLPNVVTFIMLDGFGSKGWYTEADGGAVETGTDERRGLFVSENTVLLPVVLDAVRRHSLLPAAYISASLLPVSDLGPFMSEGVPSVMIIGKPIWYHTEHDTLDKCTPDQLERTLRAHIDLIDHIQKVPGSDIKAADRKLSSTETLVGTNAGEEPPSVFFTVLPDPVPIGAMAVFYMTIFAGRDNIIVDFRWDFGDGNVITSAQPVVFHTYDAPGTYRASLTVTDDAGGTCTASRLVRAVK